MVELSLVGPTHQQDNYGANNGHDYMLPGAGGMGQHTQMPPAPAKDNAHPDGKIPWVWIILGVAVLAFVVWFLIK